MNDKQPIQESDVIGWLHVKIGATTLKRLHLCGITLGAQTNVEEVKAVINHCYKNLFGNAGQD